MTYLLHILIILGIYVILAVSLNLIAGYAGMLSISHAAFYGIGAYCAALLALNLHTNFAVNIICGMLIAAVVGVIVAWPGLRVHDDYFVVASFGFQVIIFSVMNNWVGLTRGPLGLPGIPQPEIFGWLINTHWEFLALVWLLAFLTFLVCYRLVRSPYGRVLKAIREDEIFAQSLGKNVTYFKLSVFAIGASLAAIAGAMYAYYITFIDPTSFTIAESIFLISIVIIGGLGNLWGAVVGACILIILPELLRFIGISQTYVANIRQIIYGLLLVLMMFFRPQGIIGEYNLGQQQNMGEPEAGESEP
ncbi:branched-chain amino acid ABC transporter permease [bacterium]|nr:branched-chain amino acid ABC transporter permease [bacterium]